MGARRGERRSPESEFKKGERHSVETEFHKGSIPWNKGLRYSLRRKVRPLPYQTPQLSKMQWSYIAGFFDGEGWITYRGNANSDNKTVVLGLGQKQKMILDKIRGWLNVERCLTVDRHEQWSLQIAAKDKVLVILKALKPFLIIKQEKAEKAIKYIQEDIKHHAKKRKLYVGM